MQKFDLNNLQGDPTHETDYYKDRRVEGANIKSKSHTRLIRLQIINSFCCISLIYIMNSFLGLNFITSLIIPFGLSIFGSIMISRKVNSVVDKITGHLENLNKQDYKHFSLRKNDFFKEIAPLIQNLTNELSKNSASEKKNDNVIKLKSIDGFKKAG